MSKLAKRPIPLASGVEFKLDGDVLTVKGPKGNLTRTIPQGIEFRVESDGVFTEFAKDSTLNKPMLGLYRALAQGMVEGVTKGFVIKLKLIGVGYRAAVQGTTLELLVGYSNPIKMAIPEGIKVTVEKNVEISVEGINKQQVGQFAADIRAHKKPEPYKGKGIRYENEYVRKKTGKTGK